MLYHCSDIIAAEGECIMNDKLHIYHGSEKIIRAPQYGGGRKHNDYGPGFYCTEIRDLAAEWACTPFGDGFVNHYTLDMSMLRTLDLNSEEYSILNWIAVLVSNRLVGNGTAIAGRAKKYLKEHFYVNVDAYDVIRGYRADDAYYDFADAFLNNTITVEQLARAMRLGKLGEQIVLKSQLAFDSISFEGFETAASDTFYPLRKARSNTAEREYRTICEEETDGLYMIDIIRGGVTNDDARIPRNIP